jgi:hypothetical protein
MDAIPAPFSLSQQWVRIGNDCWVIYGIGGLKYDESMEGKLN